MSRYLLVLFGGLFNALILMGQADSLALNPIPGYAPDTFHNPHKRSVQFQYSADFIDAAINSFNAFQSLLKKENYRIKVVSFNNPGSKELGFSLEMEIQAALKPLLAKAKHANPGRFSGVVTSLFQAPVKFSPDQGSILNFNPLFSTLISMVGNLAIQEKRITKEDIDSFVSVTSKYFLQYQKLNQANLVFDQDIQKLNGKMLELQFDIKEYMIDIITIVNKQVQRTQLKSMNVEELFLKFMQGQVFHQQLAFPLILYLQYPADGIKNGKEIAYSLQKLFNEYQEIYGENYQQIRHILLESRSFGSSVNLKQVEVSLKELEQLYNESRQSDMMGLRLSTLFERLRTLVNSEQPGNK